MIQPAAVRIGSIRQLGGNEADSVTAMTRDAWGNLYLTGKTYSYDFPANVLPPGTVVGVVANRCPGHGGCRHTGARGFVDRVGGRAAIVADGRPQFSVRDAQ